MLWRKKEAAVTTMCQKQRKLPITGEVISPQLSDGDAPGFIVWMKRLGLGIGHETWPWALTLEVTKAVQVS